MPGKKIFTMSLSLGLGALAYGQSFEFSADAGAIINGNTILVSGSIFTVSVWANLPTAIPSSTALNLAVAFGDAQGSGTSATPVNTFLSYVGWQWSSFSTQNYTTPLVGPQIRSAAAAQSGNNYVTTNPNLLPIVVYGARFSQTPVNVPAGLTRIAQLTFNIAGNVPLLSSQDLYVAHNGGTNAPIGSSGINPGFGSPIYRVQVVPEPATLLTMACGTFLLARSRRNSIRRA